MLDPGRWPAIRGECLRLLEAILPQTRVSGRPWDTVDQDDGLGFRLLRYRTTEARAYSLLLVPNIINRPYILDLNDDVSVVGAFLRRGLDVYTIDWGYPGPEQHGTGFTQYVRYVEKSQELISSGPLSLLGYCTGGIISLISASRRPEKVKNLILLATPVDFSMRDDPRVGAVSLFDVENAFWRYGNIPGEFANLAGVCLLGLYSPLFAASHEFLREMFSIELYRDFWRRIRWLADAQAIPAVACRQLVEDCYRRNLLILNRFKIDGRRVDLGSLRCSLLNVLARYDHLVPVESASALGKVYRGSDYQEMVFPSSHVGLSVSRRAHEELWPAVCDWLGERCKPYTSALIDSA